MYQTARGGNLFIFQEWEQCFLDPVTEVYELVHDRCCLVVSIKRKPFFFLITPLIIRVEDHDTGALFLFFLHFSFSFYLKSFRCVLQITKMLEIRRLKMPYLFSNLICFYKGIDCIVTVFRCNQVTFKYKTV